MHSLFFLGHNYYIAALLNNGGLLTNHAAAGVLSLIGAVPVDHILD